MAAKITGSGNRAAEAMMAKWAAIPATLAYASIKMYAVAEEKPKSQPVNAHQLSIYNGPPLKSRYIEEKPGRLQTGISSVRKSTSYYINGCKLDFTMEEFNGIIDSYCVAKIATARKRDVKLVRVVALGSNSYLFLKNGVKSSIQFGKDVYVYLKNPPPEFLPKVGAITISGLTGLVLARKGPRFKKIAYPMGLCTLCISLCYPAQSVIVAKVTGKRLYSASHKTYEAIGSLWTKQSTAKVPVIPDKVAEEVSVSRTDHNISEARIAVSESAEATEAHESQFHAGKTVSESSSVPLIAEVKVPSVISDAMKVPKFKPDPSLMDHGQSSPEDVDMYSTRS